MRSVLVIDDEPTILRLVRAILDGLGYETHTALDAESALALVRTVRPTLIITDVVLPGMDGSEFVRHIKSDPELSSIPILLMSAYREPDNHQADGFIAKPFDIDELSSIVRSYAGAD
jgi:CheY-like chemotaxis protein